LIPGVTWTGRAKSSVNFARTNRGRLTRIRLTDDECATPAGTIALKILPLLRSWAAFSDKTKARSELSSATAGCTMRVIETEASPRNSPPTKSAISPRVFMQVGINSAFRSGDQPQGFICRYGKNVKKPETDESYRWSNNLGCDDRTRKCFWFCSTRSRLTLDAGECLRAYCTLRQPLRRNN